VISDIGKSISRYWIITLPNWEKHSAVSGKPMLIYGRKTKNYLEKEETPTCQKRKTDLPKKKNRLANIGYTG
jgi:hypothetical protein